MPKPASEDDYAAEYLGPDDFRRAWSVRSTRRSSTSTATARSHTDAIVTGDLARPRAHLPRGVDSSAVMVNASTRFNDGGEFGLGAEIGISTDKFHARGPCGLEELTSYKYVVHGQGQVRE